VRSGGSWKFWRGAARVKLNVQMRDLKELKVSGATDFVAAEPVRLNSLRIGISGAGLVRFDQFSAEVLRIGVSGSGDAHFNGRVEKLSVSISGRSDFFGENLRCQDAQVSISGVGKAQVWAVGELNATVSGIGTVDYWGNPKLQKRASGVSTFNDRGPKALLPSSP
jgi:Putative auto-transporter adhesin, head GIN domain